MGKYFNTVMALVLSAVMGFSSGCDPKKPTKTEQVQQENNLEDRLRPGSFNTLYENIENSGLVEEEKTELIDFLKEADWNYEFLQTKYYFIHATLKNSTLLTMKSKLFFIADNAAHALYICVKDDKEIENHYNKKFYSDELKKGLENKINFRKKIFSEIVEFFDSLGLSKKNKKFECTAAKTWKQYLTKCYKLADYYVGLQNIFESIKETYTELKNNQPESRKLTGFLKKYVNIEDELKKIYDTMDSPFHKKEYAVEYKTRKETLFSLMKDLDEFNKKNKIFTLAICRQAETWQKFADSLYEDN